MYPSLLVHSRCTTITEPRPSRRAICRLPASPHQKYRWRVSSPATDPHVARHHLRRRASENLSQRRVNHSKNAQVLVAATVGTGLTGINLRAACGCDLPVA